ncbi:MAG TPA: TonB family protein [Vicinamibacterales bacterium]|nr:TonB family protein [Vicinamibacterales bacterium]
MTNDHLINLGAWSVQAGVLTVTAMLLDRLLRVDAPVARYALWRLVLLACLALPLIQPWHTQEVTAAPVLIDASGTAAGTSAIVMSPSVAAPPARTVAVHWPAVVTIVLVIGMVLRFVWLAAGLVRLRRIRHQGVPAEDAGSEALHALLDAAADVRYVTSLRQPVTFGIRHSVVLLPASLRAMPLGVQRAVLVHELWHVRRRDWLWNLSEEVLRSIFWFHPAIWHVISRVQCAREEVVDELSVLSTNARRTYLEALLAFAEEPAVYPAAPFIRRRQLFNRMMLISKEAVMSSRRIVASSVVMAGALVITGWYGVLAFPLRSLSVASPRAEAREVQAQQPRDPRADTPRPATAREQEFKTATAADPANVSNWLALAKLQEERGALTEAEATYQAALAATSGERKVLMSLAGFFTRAGQFDKAVAALEDAAARNPTDPSGHQLVAVYYWEKAQKDTSLTPADKLMYLEAGIGATDRAIAQRPDYVEALTYKNILLRMKANIETDATRRQALITEADALRARAIELSKQRTAANASSDPSAPPPPPPPPPPPLPGDYYQIDGQQAVRIGGAIAPPKKIRDVRPVYPEEARAAGVSGMVVVEIVVDAQGDVRSARVLRSIPQLDEAAVGAVKQWKFVPTVQEGVAVPVVMTVTVNFMG